MCASVGNRIQQPAWFEAGVHYFSDDYESLRMGEKIAIGILEEQALCYPTDPFIISVPTFDGQVYRIGNL